MHAQPPGIQTCKQRTQLGVAPLHSSVPQPLLDGVKSLLCCGALARSKSPGGYPPCKLLLLDQLLPKLLLALRRTDSPSRDTLPSILGGTLSRAGACGPGHGTVDELCSTAVARCCNWRAVWSASGLWLGPLPLSSRVPAHLRHRGSPLNQAGDWMVIGLVRDHTKLCSRILYHLFGSAQSTNSATWKSAP